MPPRGGIAVVHPSVAHDLRFKSCPREGASLYSSDIVVDDSFQVMPPRGGIPSTIMRTVPAVCFKSCPREGASPPLDLVLRRMSFKSCPREGASSFLAEIERGKSFKSCPREGASDEYRRSATTFEFQVMPP